MTESQIIGGTWTATERPCSECGTGHKHLTDMADGRHLCIPCLMAAPDASREQGLSHED